MLQYSARLHYYITWAKKASLATEVRKSLWLMYLRREGGVSAQWCMCNVMQYKYIRICHHVFDAKIKITE